MHISTALLYIIIYIILQQGDKMKFKIQRQEITKAVNIIKEALPNKTVIESLKGIKIEATNEKIIFTASRQDVIITYTATSNFEIDTPGVSIIPGSYLITIINKSEENLFEFSQESGTTTVKTRKSKMKLVEYDSSSYPDVKFDLEKGTKIAVPVQILKAAYSQTKYSVAQNNLKPILTGLNFKFNVDGLVVGSTDARRLSISTFKNENNDDVEFTIYKNLLGSIIKILDTLNLEEINLVTDQNQITVDAGSVQMKGRLLEGKFPDIERLIPSVTSYKYEVESKKLLAVLEKIQLLSDRDNGNVTTKIKEGNLLLEAYFKELGGIEEICSIDNLIGNPFSISFDPKFLIDAVHAIDKERLVLEFVDEISVFLITGIDSRDNIQIIAPIRLT
jgi:DNA polymerase-3 subunit beta